MASNKTYDEINIGDTASITRVCTANDLFIFANASGNLNPLHIPDIDHTGDGKKDLAIAPSMWVGALVSAVLGSILPGPGTIYRSQCFTFHERAHEGDTLEVTVTVTAKEPDGIVRLATKVMRDTGELIADGEATVSAPPEKIHLEDHEIPHILVERHQHFDRLVELAQTLPPLPTAVIMPEDTNSLGGALLAANSDLIVPILIGSRARIEETAKTLNASLNGIEIIDIADTREAVLHGIALVGEGRALALMKGNLHTDALLSRVVDKKTGLRTDRRLSHVFVMDVPMRAAPMLISDAAINIAPDLKWKVDITQNAIDVARAIGIEVPKVGILSAVETVTPAIPSTLDAAILSKMAERGQIKGGIVDGPLAMDNAIDANAARTKGITSLVAGHADVLIVPNMEAGNMLAKELTFISHAQSAGLVVGARVPVILTSRADDDRSRLASCALALLYNHWSKTGEALRAEGAAQ